MEVDAGVIEPKPTSFERVDAWAKTIDERVNLVHGQAETSRRGDRPNRSSRIHASG